MTSRGVVAIALAGVMVLGTASTFARQTSGTIGGRAQDEARAPYTNYTVQVRDTTTGQVVGTAPLDAQGRFTMDGVTLNQRMLVELVQTQQNAVVCTEGPYLLTSTSPNKLDVNIDCGKAPAALWILTAGAGAAAAIGFATQSGSR